MEHIEELLTRGVANIIPHKELLKKALLSGKKLNIYLGIDPTATAIHLGHVVPLRKLQSFAMLGHNVTFLIGDFTALIGDTSDKETERPSLTEEQIESNFRTYKQQAEKYLDFSLVTIKHNSQWLKNLTFADIITLTRHYSAGEFISRELIKKRLADGKHVGVHEFLYPVMQGYDSYTLDCDIQLGGTDQTFNMQAGRILQKDLRGKESFVLTNPFLTGTDGRKMSKSWGNAIWLTDTPEDIFGKVMSLKDELIIEYFTLATNTPIEHIHEIEEKLNSNENPMAFKMQLATKIVTEIHSETDAREAQKQFSVKFQKKDYKSAELELVSKQSLVGDSLINQMTHAGLFTSKSDGRRLFDQHAIEINNQCITDIFKPMKFSSGDIIKIGKRKIIKVG